MKLFHKAPEGGPFKTGINYTFVTTSIIKYQTRRGLEKHTRVLALYLAKKNSWFIGGYFIMGKKWRIEFTHSRKWSKNRMQDSERTRHGLA